MPVLIHNHSETLANWAATKIPHVPDGFGDPAKYQAIGIASGPGERDELYAVVVFHDLQPTCRTVQISMAARSPKWATKGVLRALLWYPFVQLGVFKVWTATPSDNERALRFNEGIGFKREAALRHHGGPGRHCVVCSMIEPEWRKSRWYVPSAERKAA